MEQTINKEMFKMVSRSIKVCCRYCGRELGFASVLDDDGTLRVMVSECSECSGTVEDYDSGYADGYEIGYIDGCAEAESAE